MIHIQQRPLRVMVIFACPKTRPQPPNKANGSCVQVELYREWKLKKRTSQHSNCVKATYLSRAETRLIDESEIRNSDLLIATDFAEAPSQSKLDIIFDKRITDQESRLADCDKPCRGLKSVRARDLSCN